MIERGGTRLDQSRGKVGGAGMALCWLAAVGCGGGAEPPTATAPPAATSGGEVAPAHTSGMQVSGLLGTIPQRKIEERLQAKLPIFQRCFFSGSQDVEMLAGHFKFYFHVELDGRVGWVSPRGSSIGHRGTELCLLHAAEQVRFPEPKGGGPAEFVWGFEIEAPGGVRPALAWDEERVSKTLAAHRNELRVCDYGDAHYIVTTYVAPGGSVIAAGAAADSQAAADKIDCLVDAIKTWQFPEPGSYPAKVSFGL
jgi:hypothetical protein